MLGFAGSSMNWMKVYQIRRSWVLKAGLRLNQNLLSLGWKVMEKKQNVSSQNDVEVWYRGSGLEQRG